MVIQSYWKSHLDTVGFNLYSDLEAKKIGVDIHHTYSRRRRLARLLIVGSVLAMAVAAVTPFKSLACLSLAFMCGAYIVFNRVKRHVNADRAKIWCLDKQDVQALQEQVAGVPEAQAVLNDWMPERFKIRQFNRLALEQMVKQHQRRAKVKPARKNRFVKTLRNKDRAKSLSSYELKFSPVTRKSA